MESFFSILVKHPRLNLSGYSLLLEECLFLIVEKGGLVQSLSQAWIRHSGFTICDIQRLPGCCGMESLFMVCRSFLVILILG